MLSNAPTLTHKVDAALADLLRGQSVDWAALEATDTRLELGRALYQRALMRRRPEHAEAILQDVKRACELFAACGALRDLKRAEAMLHR